MDHLARSGLVALCVLSLVGCSDAPTATVDAGHDANVTRDGGTEDAGGADARHDVDASVADAGDKVDSGAVGLPSAYLSDSCGPADGPAIQLLVFEAPGTGACTADHTRRSLRFYVHDLGGATIAPSAGDTITSTPGTSSGTATECPGGTPPCRVSETWTLHFETYVGDGGAIGTYSITWGDGSTTRGQFDATRCETEPIRCG